MEGHIKSEKGSSDLNPVSVLESTLTANPCGGSQYLWKCNIDPIFFCSKSFSGKKDKGSDGSLAWQKHHLTSLTVVQPPRSLLCSLLNFVEDLVCLNKPSGHSAACFLSPSHCCSVVLLSTARGEGFSHPTPTPWLLGGVLCISLGTLPNVVLCAGCTALCTDLTCFHYWDSKLS